MRYRAQEKTADGEISFIVESAKSREKEISIRDEDNNAENRVSESNAKVL